MPSRPDLTSEAPDVCVVLHDLRGGGAERAMLRLCGGMADLGATVELVLAQRKGDYLKLVPPAVTVVDLSASSVAGAVPALVRHLRRRRPKAVLSALTHTNLAVIVACRLAGHKGRLVVSERNQISEKAREARSARARLTYALTPRLYRLADKIIAVSKGVADDLVSFARLPADKVGYVYNPVYDEALVAAAALPSPHPWLEEATPVVLAVGRLHPQKDFETLIRAFAKARAARPCRLLILGEGPEREKLEGLARALEVSDDVAMPGFAANPMAAMGRASVFVLSSRWEGFPNVLVEAMACGAPVVATNCPSGPMEILDSGAFGPLAPMGDVDQIAEGIVKMLDAPSDREVTRRRASLYSVEAASRAYMESLGLKPK